MRKLPRGGARFALAAAAAFALGAVDARSAQTRDDSAAAPFSTLAAPTPPLVANTASDDDWPWG